MATAQNNLARHQIYIPATQPETELCLRVAAYCRVSSDSSDQLNSFAAQQNHYSEYIRSQDRWEMVDIYADEGITGTSAIKRDDFQRMLSDCRKGRIDKILVKSISRFARNTMECLDAIRELKALGISIFFEEHNIDTKMVSSEMLTAVIAACAQAESESISKNMRWGIKKRMEKGTYIASSVPYGYRMVDELLVIQEAEATVVRRIFEEYLAGQTPLEIASKLIQEGNRDREWSESTIKYILRNERYAGDAVFQKTFTTETLPFQRKKNKGELAKYYVENSNPAIITADMYTAVQKSIAHRSKLRVASPGDMPLSGKVECGICQAPCMVRFNKGKSYISCRTHDMSIEECPMKPVRVDSIYDAFRRMHFILRNNPQILSEIEKSLHIVKNRQMLWSPDIVEINKRISDISSQNHSLTLLNKQGLVDSDMFISMSNRLAEQLRKAKQEKEYLRERMGDNTIELTQDVIEVLDDSPEYLDHFDEELFCELIEKIVVESNTRIRFMLKNGLEIPEEIERTAR